MQDDTPIGSDAFELIYRRYIQDDPARVASFQKELSKAKIASEIYELRHEAGLTRERLADQVGVSPSVIEDIEESDYDGDFLAMASRIAATLHRTVEVHFHPQKTRMAAKEEAL